MKWTRNLLASALLLLSVSAAAAQSPQNDFRTRFLAGDLEWDAVLAQAKEEGEVTFYHWGGSDNLNVWIDQVVAPAMAAQGIRLEAVRIADTRQAVDLILAEARSGHDQPGTGSVDALWVNGENFLSLDQQDLLFGSFADRLPNSSHFSWDPADPRSTLNLRDFGTPTLARELPWSSEQFVCAANRAVMDVHDTPRTLGDLEGYLTNNPGTFTYVRPPNYIGNTFVQQVLYAMNPDGTGSDPFQAGIEELGIPELARLAEPGLDYLRRLEPLLLGGGQGQTIHPADAAEAQGLFRNREIHLHCEFGTYATAVNVETGSYPEQAEEIIFPAGAMIANKSFIAIPASAPNPAAALVFANYMASIEAQASKLSDLGYPAGIDAWMLGTADAALLEAAAPPHIGVTQEELENNLAPDTNASLVDLIEAAWIARVEQKSDRSVEEVMQDAYDKRLAR
jgi:putative spermidine/putrescine transport system substrate-binding protein